MRGLHYQPQFVSADERKAVMAWLSQIHPIWEWRYSPEKPLPAGQTNRRLLRPVYWLGSWQFACLDYYHPPKRTANCAIKAEPFPAVLAQLVARIEKIARKMFDPKELPRGWHLNTCLVNLYGDQIQKGRKIDCARVGEHKDFEPGPVASLSFGERAFFQFVKSRGRNTPSIPVLNQWLDDRSLQVFGGRRWKDELFHRVQRVEKKLKTPLPPSVPEFETRRINLTFRYIPDEHIVDFKALPPETAGAVRSYIRELALHSPYFATV